VRDLTHVVIDPGMSDFDRQLVLVDLQDHALAGQAGCLRDGRGAERCGWPGEQGVASRRPPPGLSHGSPGTEPHSARTGSVDGCPWAAA
jgi:hypothetical protein